MIPVRVQIEDNFIYLHWFRTARLQAKSATTTTASFTATTITIVFQFVAVLGPFHRTQASHQYATAQRIVVVV